MHTACFWWWFPHHDWSWHQNKPVSLLWSGELELGWGAQKVVLIATTGACLWCHVVVYMAWMGCCWISPAWLAVGTGMCYPQVSLMMHVIAFQTIFLLPPVCELWCAAIIGWSLCICLTFSVWDGQFSVQDPIQNLGIQFLMQRGCLLRYSQHLRYGINVDEGIWVWPFVITD